MEMGLDSRVCMGLGWGVFCCIVTGTSTLMVISFEGAGGGDSSFVLSSEHCTS
jgi:hypothetical protein